jgi:hypothetical protein
MSETVMLPHIQDHVSSVGLAAKLILEQSSKIALIKLSGTTFGSQVTDASLETVESFAISQITEDDYQAVMELLDMIDAQFKLKYLSILKFANLK